MISRQKQKVLVIFGSPGSGKGTASLAIEEKFKDIKHISAGDILRNSNDNKIKESINKGVLLSDEEMIDIFSKHLKYSELSSKILLLDGFPRTGAQVEYIVKNFDLISVIELVVSDEVAYSRLVGRGRSSGRVDDAKEIILNRLKINKSVIEGIKKGLKANDIIPIKINAESSMEEMNESVINALKPIINMKV